jgi:hypothetical protein
VKATVYLVMTVTMDRRQGAVPVVRPMAIAVMAFDQGFRLAVASARLAAPGLLL